MTNHGSSNAYNKGCRCVDCKCAHAERMRATRAKLAQRPSTDIPHGTRGGYTNWHCRCQPCTTASSDANYEAGRRYAARQRAKRKGLGE